jgi:predicted exporter
VDTGPGTTHAGARRPLTPEAFLGSAAGASSRHLWLGQVGAEHASIVALRGLRDYRQLDKFAALARDIPGVQWVDKVGEISSVLRYYRQYMGWALLGAYVDLRAALAAPGAAPGARWRRQWWPACSLGLFGWLGQPLQLFHVLAALLVLGLGVDYGSSAGVTRAGPSPCLADRGPVGGQRPALLGLLALSGSPPLHAFGLTMPCGMLLVWLLAPVTHPGANHALTDKDPA